MQMYCQEVLVRNSAKIVTDPLQSNDSRWCLAISWKNEGQWQAWQGIEQHSPVFKNLLGSVGLVWVWRFLKRIIKHHGIKDKMQIPTRNRLQEVLQEIHNGITGEHLCVTKTLEKLRYDFTRWIFWQIIRIAQRSRAPIRQYTNDCLLERLSIDVARPIRWKSWSCHSSWLTD